MKRILSVIAFSVFSCGAFAAEDCAAFGPGCMTDAQFVAAQKSAGTLPEDCTAFGPGCMTDKEFAHAQYLAFGSDCGLCLTDKEFASAQTRAGVQQKD